MYIKGKLVKNFNITYTLLAHVMNIRFNLDEERTNRALEILSRQNGVMRSRKDLEDLDRAPDYDLIQVQKSNPGTDFDGFYIVDTENKTCQCKDFTSRGVICKHRRAAYLWMQLSSLELQTRDDANQTIFLSTVYATLSAIEANKVSKTMIDFALFPVEDRTYRFTKTSSEAILSKLN